VLDEADEVEVDVVLEVGRGGLARLGGRRVGRLDVVELGEEGGALARGLGVAGRSKSAGRDSMCEGWQRRSSPCRGTERRAW
jgi:hypothetical protein